MKTAADISDIRLPDTNDDPVRMGDLWANGQVVLVWLRHYG